VPRDEIVEVEKKRIESLDELVGVVARYREEGLVTVFTNGCFDLLHVGHVRSLVDARSRGDRLIVAINSDRSIRAMKGPPLPIYPEEERVEIVGALACVDHVFVFDDLTVDHILSKARPDVHAKGGDYTEENLPERETVLGYGGTIAIVGGPKTHSTRDLIRKIGSLQDGQRV
jgi:rfaE bifunctional protein nucleotidyltransferase chain/domain